MLGAAISLDVYGPSLSEARPRDDAFKQSSGHAACDGANTRFRAVTSRFGRNARHRTFKPM
jgi:hypothetical protein